jgi:imidazolonepropionase-like amidohydrolase
MATMKYTVFTNTLKNYALVSKKQLTTILLAAISTTVMAQQPVPAQPQTKSVLLMNGTAHLGDGNVINTSAIGFKDGKLNLVANALMGTVDQSQYDEVIDIKGKHVYPGFIAPNSTLGITEIGAVRATRDFRETGTMNPNVRSIIAYNTDSKITPTVRTNGILMAQVTPRGGAISGTSSIVGLDGWNWEDAVYKMDDGIHMNWPRLRTSGGWWAEPAPAKKNDKYAEQLGKIRSFFADAKAYGEISHVERDLRFEAMRGLFDGNKTLFIHANKVKQITEAINFSKEMKVSKLVIVGGYEAWMVAGLLKDNNVAVMLRRVHDLPTRAEEDVDLPYKMPAILQKAGVLFCLENSGDMEAMGTRNLPFYAGTAATYGLTKEEALMTVTSNTAKILGIDKTVGTLEVGKDATIFVSAGDALDMLTNDVEHAFILGKKIQLTNHQMELNEKYKAKYGHK